MSEAQQPQDGFKAIALPKELDETQREWEKQKNPEKDGDQNDFVTRAELTALSQTVTNEIDTDLFAQGLLSVEAKDKLLQQLSELESLLVDHDNNTTTETQALETAVAVQLESLVKDISADTLYLLGQDDPAAKQNALQAILLASGKSEIPAENLALEIAAVTKIGDGKVSLIQEKLDPLLDGALKGATKITNESGSLFVYFGETKKPWNDVFTDKASAEQAAESTEVAPLQQSTKELITLYLVKRGKEGVGFDGSDGALQRVAREAGVPVAEITAFKAIKPSEGQMIGLRAMPTGFEVKVKKADNTTNWQPVEVGGMFSESAAYLGGQQGFENGINKALKEKGFMGMVAKFLGNFLAKFGIDFNAFLYDQGAIGSFARQALGIKDEVLPPKQNFEELSDGLQNAVTQRIENSANQYAQPLDTTVIQSKSLDIQLDQKAQIMFNDLSTRFVENGNEAIRIVSGNMKQSEQKTKSGAPSTDTLGTVTLQAVSSEQALAMLRFLHNGSIKLGDLTRSISIPESLKTEDGDEEKSYSSFRKDLGYPDHITARAVGTNQIQVTWWPDGDMAAAMQEVKKVNKEQTSKNENPLK